MQFLHPNRLKRNSALHPLSLFADLQSWASVAELDLGSNKLTRIPDEISYLARLEVLSLGYNELKVNRRPLTFVCLNSWHTWAIQGGE